MAYLARIKVVVGLAALVAVACGKDGGAEDPQGNGAPQGGEAGATATGGGGTATGGRSSGGGSGEGAEGGEATGAGGAAGGAPTAGGDAGGAGTGGDTGTIGGMLTGGAPTAGDDAGGAGGSTTGGMLTGGAPTAGSGPSGAGTSTTGGSSDPGAAAGVAGDAGGTGSVPTIALCTLGQVTCDDGLACNGVETCDPVAAGADAVTGCAPGTPLVCPDEDGIACTVEYCSAATDSCTSLAQDAVCNDGAYCNGIETCSPGAEGADAATGCLPGEPVVCEEDEASCTTVTCDDDAGRCVAEPDDAACADAVFCNGAERCDPGATGADAVTGCVPGEDPCPPDDLGCTNDGCDEYAGCVHLPDDSLCVDDSTCNGSEFCHPELGCTANDAVVCTDDGFTCTVEGCSEPDGTCATRVDPEICGDVPCDPADPDADPTTGCVEKPCTGNGDCLDADVCNGIEYCDTGAGFCRLSVPALDCSDGYDCTAESCDPATGCEDPVPIQGLCLDTNRCNGTEACDPTSDAADPTTGCVAGTVPDCDDGLDCTTDVCSFSVGCEHLPNHAACQDGQLCNGEERCDASAGCVAGSPYVCPTGGSDCSTYVCDPVQNGCVAVPDNSACPCGQTCDPEQGCGNWCEIAACQGSVYQCGDCVDNDGDCLPDSADSACLGPCSNNEEGFKGEIPGQNEANTCVAECYFDGDSGGGNDGCVWDYTCDPLSGSPYFLPKGASKCEYDAANVTCAGLVAAQSTQCWDMDPPVAEGDNVCGPLTPNGCDCFGCCAVPELSWNVWLGTQNDAKVGTCTPDVLASTTLSETEKRALCWPCTQVDSCLNECGLCEICFGKPTIDPSCTPTQQCPGGEQACGVPGQDPCPSGFYCITGCCQPLPQ